MGRFLITYKYSIGAVLSVGLCVIYYFMDPNLYKLAPKCPVKLFTTLNCPGCGFQRALHAVLHGHFIEAVHYNLFLLIAIPITCLWFINGAILERVTIQQIKIRLLYFNRMLIYTYITCYFCWFVIRNMYNY